MKLEYPKILEAIARHGHDHARVLGAFMRIAACCMVSQHLRSGQWYHAVINGVPNASRMLEVANREAQCVEELQRWEKPDRDLFGQAFGAMLIDAQNNEYNDVLGYIYMEWSGQKMKQWSGEFYTPIDLCYMIAKMSLNETSFLEPEPVTFNDCACGSGNMMLGTIRAMREINIPATRCVWVLQDIAKIGCDMAFVNSCLYGVPALIIHGDSLTLKEWNRYYTPWYPIAHGNLNQNAVAEKPPAPILSHPMLEKLLQRQDSLFAFGKE